MKGPDVCKHRTPGGEDCWGEGRGTSGVAPTLTPAPKELGGLESSHDISLRKPSVREMRDRRKQT